MAPQTLARVSLHRNWSPMSFVGQGAVMNASCVPVWDFPLLSSFAFLVSFLSFYDGHLEPRVSRRCLNGNPGLRPWLRTNEDSVLYSAHVCRAPFEGQSLPLPVSQHYRVAHLLCGRKKLSSQFSSAKHFWSRYSGSQGGHKDR